MTAFWEAVTELLRQSDYAGQVLLLICKSTLIVTLAVFITSAIRRATAAARHLVWTLAFLSLLSLPFISLTLPGWHLKVLPEIGNSINPTADFSTPAPLPGPIEPAAVARQDSRGEVTQPALAAIAPSSQAAVTVGRPLLTMNWPMMLLLLWLMGALTMIAGLLRENFVIRQVARLKSTPATEGWAELILEARRRLLQNRPLDVKSSPGVPMPLTFGLLQPVILLPQDADSWPAAKRLSVLLHEMAHIRRQDYLINLLTEVVCALYWFHPLVRIAARRMRLEREQACDDYVIRQGVARQDYADHLLTIARQMSITGVLPRGAVGMAQKSDLKNRLQHILSGNISRQALSRRNVVVSGCIGLLLLLPLAIVQLQGSVDARSKHPAAVPDISGDALQTLLRDLRSNNPSLQKKAAWMLGTAELESAADPLIAALSDNQPEVRAMAAWALGEIKLKSSVAPLLDALTDPDRYAREMIVRAIGELEDPSAVPALVNMLRDPGADVRNAAVWSLGEIGTLPALAAVRQSLKDSDSSVRDAALDVIGNHQPENIAATLREMLRDDHPDVRGHSARLLGQIEDPLAIDGLILSLQDHQPGVRVAAARALGKIGDPRAVDALMAILRDSDHDLRSAAIWALDEIHLN